MFSVDVLIAGGGVAGLLVAAKATELGYSCMIVEPVAFAAQQSGHSHGYIHRGYIYLNGNSGLVRQLRSAREDWDSFIAKPLTVHSSTHSSHIGFHNSEVARYAARAWKAAGLPVVPLAREDWPEALGTSSPLRSCFKTEEESFDFTRIVENIRARLRSCGQVKGRLVRLYLRKMICTGAEIAVDDSVRKVEARAVVLAAGIGNGEILADTFGRYRAAPTVRSSYMMVVRGQSLKSVSMILPENEFYGFFLVSRLEDNEVVWLLSNYISYGGDTGNNSLASRLWAKATLRSLDTLFPVLRTSDLLWGMYAAPKAEFRRDPEYLPDGKIIEHFGMQNVVAIWPTKLSLAPVVASDVVDMISKTLHEPKPESSAQPDWLIGGQRIDTSEETWRSVELVDRFNFERSILN